MNAPALLGRGDLAEAELAAAVLDGELYRLGERFRPIDLPFDSAARAASLCDVIVHQRVAAGATAAWIWGAIEDPGTPYTAFVPSSARVAHPSGIGDGLVRVRVMRLPQSDVATVCGTPVTTPLRTAIDLLCGDAPGHSLDGLLDLVRLAGVDTAALAQELRGRLRLGGRARALARLQVLVTR